MSEQKIKLDDKYSVVIREDGSTRLFRYDEDHGIPDNPLHAAAVRLAHLEHLVRRSYLWFTLLCEAADIDPETTSVRVLVKKEGAEDKEAANIVLQAHLNEIELALDIEPGES